MLGLFEEKRKGERKLELKLKLDLSDNLPKSIHSDPTRLRQILINLVGNAVKFTQEGSVTLKAALSDDDPHPCIRFEITDTGIGIGRDVMDKLFMDFTQADPSISRQFQGTGLGLSICKRLVELLGGEIGAESELGQGTTFWFTLPYVKASAEVNETKVEEKHFGRSYRSIRALNVLVADDNFINQQIISAYMTKLGHAFVCVENGALVIEALKKATKSFDLILMDVRMPEMSGPDATRAIRKMTGDEKRIPIIALTADAMEEHQKAYIEAGNERGCDEADRYW